MNRIYATALLLCLALVAADASAAVSKWSSTQIRIDNPEFSGNPFDIDLKGTFSSPTGRDLKVWGYYDGGVCTESNAKRCVDDADCNGSCKDEQWVIEFMCDEVGQWSYTTSSSTRTVGFLGNSHTLRGDPDLEGVTGTVDCVGSTSAGPLEPVNRRWRYRDSSEYIAPIGYVTKYFIRANNPEGTGPDGESMTTLAGWLNDNGAHIIGTNLLTRNQNDTLGNSISQEDRIYVDASVNGGQATPDTNRFYLPVWDRMKQNHDLFRDHGIGLYVRLYADDSDKPEGPWLEAGGPEEFRLFRYVVARIAPYPTVIWDTGIDLAEYRSQSWAVEFVDWMANNDPWQHPASSRCCSSGNPGHPSNGTHYSDGAKDVPAFSGMINDWKRSISTFYTDHWREDNNRGGWCTTISCSGGATVFESGDNRYLIRGAAWQSLIVPVGAIFSNRHPTDTSPGIDRYLTEAHYGTFLAAPDIQKRNEFMSQIRDYRNMKPEPSILVSGANVMTASNGSDEFIAYALKTHTSSFALDLSSAAGAMTAYWYNPLTGGQTAISGISGGTTATFSPPDGNDWALHVFAQDGPPQVPDPPSGLSVE